MSARTRQRPGLGSPDAARTTAAVDSNDTPTGTAVEAGLSQRGAASAAPDPSFRLVSDEHVAFLAGAAITPEVAVACGVRTVTTGDDLDPGIPFRGHVPGIVFPWRSPSGTVVEQYRPDHPPEDEHGRLIKYVFPKGSGSPLNLCPVTADRDPATILFVEGTKQTLAAVSNVAEDVMVVGVAGCWGWSHDGVPDPDLALLPVEGRQTVVCFDADISTNRNVYDAAKAFSEALVALGSAGVAFVSIPGTSKAGLDDYLATVPNERRARVLAGLVDRADKLPRRAPAKARSATSVAGVENSNRFFNENGLMAVSLARSIRDDHDLAIGPDGDVWIYADDSGIYERHDHRLVAATRDALGELWRRSYHDNAMALIAADLHADGAVLPAAPFGKLVAVGNGMLDVIGGTLQPFDSEHLAWASLAVPWDPTATCPRFDAWMTAQCGTQTDDLLESVGLLLAPSAGQRKTPFLIGPTRSGKGTFLHLIESIVGERHRASVTLHDLVTNRFASGDLVGAVLNSAGDLSDRHLDDLAVFKSLTGGDSIRGERKFRDAFTFRNTALWIFSANTPPTVAETSRAYTARIRPYLFPNSFEDHEDPQVLVGLKEELPGILVRLVEGVRRWYERGGYLPINPEVRDLFERQSDPVAMFVSQTMERVADGFVGSVDLCEGFGRWAEINRRSAVGRNKLLGRVSNVLGDRTRRNSDGTGPRGWHGWRILPEVEWSDDSAAYSEVAPAVSSVPASSAGFIFTSPREDGNAKDVDPDSTHTSRGEVGPEPAELAEGPAELSDDPIGTEVF